MKSFFSSIIGFVSSLFYSLRPLNLFLILLTQTLTCVFLLDNLLCISNLFSKLDFIAKNCIDFYFLVLATVLSAAGGYILNDIFDRKIDLINSPKRGSFTEKNISFLYLLSSLFFGTALLLGLLVSFKIGIAVLFSCALLIFYAKNSKKIGILKPVFVSFLTAFSILLVGFDFFDSFNFIPSTVWLFSVWAFLLSMLREVIKDFEDLEGDSSQNSLTSVVQLGKKNSLWLLYFLSVLLISSLFLAFFISTNSISTSLHKLIMIALIGIFIFLLNKNHSTSSKKQYKKLSLFCKLMMLVGILGMCFY
ncbi:geranylgeranylglycerol-phosphate geranylgeranyltransferase [Bernardetia sp. OM2101]|uniref:geranylgeranylglycerol-phosphate geranylgeranyltransferase n=1 Tax=Bernardetia sp. OM2101 TaxID=3344876 RepID=UPI0035CF70E7